MFYVQSMTRLSSQNIPYYGVYHGKHVDRTDRNENGTSVKIFSEMESIVWLGPPLSCLSVGSL